MISPRPSLVSQSRQGIKSNQQNAPELLALPASFLLALVLANGTIFSACCASYRLAHGPAGSICQPKVGNLGTLCLNRGCSLPVLSCVVPCFSHLLPFTTSRPKDQADWLWEAGSRGHLHNHPLGTSIFLTVVWKTLLLSMPSPIATRILTSLLFIHVSLPCRHSLENSNLVKGWVLS